MVGQRRRRRARPGSRSRIPPPPAPTDETFPDGSFVAHIRQSRPESGLGFEKERERETYRV